MCEWQAQVARAKERGCPHRVDGRCNPDCEYVRLGVDCEVTVANACDLCVLDWHVCPELRFPNEVETKDPYWAMDRSNFWDREAHCDWCNVPLGRTLGECSEAQQWCGKCDQEEETRRSRFSVRNEFEQTYILDEIGKGTYIPVDQITHVEVR